MTKLDSSMRHARSLVLPGDVEHSALWHSTIERKGAAIEFKFVSEGDPGVFEGYGGIFGNVDSYGDLILPGAFAASLAEHKAKGTMPGMYAEHSIYTPGGDLLPIGRWLDMSESPLPRRIKRVRLSIASPLTRPSPNGRRVGIRIVTFEACSGFTHVTARQIAQPPTGDLCHEAPTHAVTRTSRSSATGSIDNSPGGFFLH